MGNGASTSHLHIPLVESDDQVCRDLYAAAHDDDIDAVAKLLPLARSKGVLNKVRRAQCVRDTGYHCYYC